MRLLLGMSFSKPSSFTALTRSLGTTVTIFAPIPVTQRGHGLKRAPKWTSGLLFWLLLQVGKAKQKKKMLPALLMSSLLVPRIMCLFVENDFMYLLYKRLESGDALVYLRLDLL